MPLPWRRNSLAILRVSNLTIAARLKERPGIIVPDSVRAAIKGLEGAEGRARGIKLAKEITAAALGKYRGVYLITPFLQYETTVELAEFARAV